MKPRQVVADGHGMSHRDIAKVLGLSPCRVQQLEASALRKLRLGLGIHLAEDIEFENREQEKKTRRQRAKRLRERAACDR